MGVDDGTRCGGRTEQTHDQDAHGPHLHLHGPGAAQTLEGPDGERAEIVSDEPLEPDDEIPHDDDAIPTDDAAIPPGRIVSSIDGVASPPDVGPIPQAEDELPESRAG